jgi:hypothetical protein
MKLVFIHGAPGAGKLTTARALLARQPGRLFDNHASIDVVRTVFDFGAPGFWELVNSVRVSVVDAAAKHGTPLVVMTFVYVEPDDLPIFEQFETAVTSYGGELLPVFLRCSIDAIVRRVGHPDRVARRKISSEKSAREYMARHRISAVPRSSCLVLDSQANDADTNAGRIISHFNLRT